MRVSNAIGCLLAAATAFATPVTEAGDSAAAESQIEARQSGRTTKWIDGCTPGSPGPNSYRAFDLGDCNYQLTLTRDRGMIGVLFEFEAIYADGSRVKHAPARDYSNIALSDPFYAVDLGNNWITRSAGGGRNFTSVHELTNVCRNGAGPVGWYFLASDDSGCGRPKGYTFTSPQIGITRGVSRPGQTRPTARRINDAGDYEITWDPVQGAAAYTVMFQVPTSSDDLGNPYTQVIGSRQLAPTTRAVHQGIIRFRWEGRARKVAVNVVNAQGVWNLARDSPNVAAPW